MSIWNTEYEYLKNKYYGGENEGWVAGGRLEMYVREVIGSKPSNASRRLRELENMGAIEKRYVQINGKGPKVVQYRYHPMDYPRVEPRKESVGFQKAIFN